MNSRSLPTLLAIFALCTFLLVSCTDEKKSSQEPATDKKAAQGEAKDTLPKDAETQKTAEVTGIPAEHMQNYMLGWSKDSAHFGWVTVDKDSEGLLSWRLWVLNVVTGVMPPFGNGTQIAQAAAFTGEQYPDANSRNSAAYAFFSSKYIDPLELQGFPAEAAIGEVLYKAESQRDSFKGGLKNDWTVEFKNSAMQKLALLMNVSVSEKETEFEKKAADGDAALEKITCKVKQSLLKISLSIDDSSIPQIISPGANYYYGVSAFHPILLLRSPNDSNIVAILEKYNDTECGEHKAGYMGIEAAGAVIIGKQSAKK